MELMLVNLRLLGLIDRDLSQLKKYSETVAAKPRTPRSRRIIPSSAATRFAPRPASTPPPS